jgi:hypothetical protein
VATSCTESSKSPQLDGVESVELTSSSCNGAATVCIHSLRAIASLLSARTAVPTSAPSPAVHLVLPGKPRGAADRHAKAVRVVRYQLPCQPPTPHRSRPAQHHYTRRVAIRLAAALEAACHNCWLLLPRSCTRRISYCRCDRCSSGRHGRSTAASTTGRRRERGRRGERGRWEIWQQAAPAQGILEAVQQEAAFSRQTCIHACAMDQGKGAAAPLVQAPLNS